jgi:hypothetical protein
MCVITLNLVTSGHRIFISEVSLYWPFLSSGIFSSTRPRWKNTNVPFPGTVVQITGLCSRVLDSANHAVKIENIILNVPTSPNVPASSGETGEEQVASKKCKFSAIASTLKPRAQKFVCEFYLPRECVAYLTPDRLSWKVRRKQPSLRIGLHCNRNKSLYS